MTEQEFMQAAAQLEQADTELAAIDVEIAKAITNARVHNTARKVLEVKRDEIRAGVQPMRNAVEKYMVEKKRRDAEAAKAQAEANAAKAREAAEKAKAEAEAKKQAEQSKIDELTATVKQLQEQLAAKG